MSRSMCAMVLLALMVSGCGLASGTSPSSHPSDPSEPGPTPSATASGDGISQEEAIEIASDFRANPDTVFETAVSGPFGEFAWSEDTHLISPGQQVWAVTFVGDVDVGCDYSDCPKSGMETVFIAFRTGELLLSQTYSPQN